MLYTLNTTSTVDFHHVYLRMTKQRQSKDEAILKQKQSNIEAKAKQYLSKDKAKTKQYLSKMSHPLVTKSWGRQPTVGWPAYG